MDANGTRVAVGTAPTPDKPIHGDIYHGTSACRRSLQGCQPIAALIDGGWAENRLSDFNLWAAGVGASAEAHVSLDWRLHFQPEARVVLTNLLFVLKGLVEQCKNLGLQSDRDEPDAASHATNEENIQPHDDHGLENTSPEDASAWIGALGSDSEDEESLSQSSTTHSEEDQHVFLRQAMKHTEDVLDQLIRLGYAIRRSGGTSRLRKADSSFREGDHEAFRQHLGLVLLLEARKPLVNRERGADGQDSRGKSVVGRVIDPETAYNQLNQLQKRLVHANLRRRHRFLYARRHQEKLERHRYASVFQDTEGSSLPTETAGTERTAVTRRPAKKTPAKQIEVAPGEPAMTTTMASEAEGDVLRAASGLSQAASRISVTAAKLSYPSPPPAVPGMRSFRCPCCRQTLPDMFRDWSRWRKHLSEDLCPYTCPFEDCQEGVVLYASRGSWRAHISKRHIGTQYWECLSCAGMEELRAFDSATAFSTHLRGCHSDTIDETQITSLLMRCCVTEPSTLPSCPLCSQKKEDWDSMDPESQLGHVGDCIHEFSLRALPWAQWADGELPPSRRPELDETVHAWLSSAVFSNIDGSTELAPRYLPAHTQALAPEERFTVGEYFAEGSESSSRVERGFSSAPSSDHSEPSPVPIHPSNKAVPFRWC